MTPVAAPDLIVACGESLFDVFATQDTPTGVALDARIGGSPFNVAIGLARLGRPAAFVGAMADNFLGDRLLRALAAEGVDTRAVARVSARTTLALVGLDAAGVPSYAFYGDGAADRQLQPAMLDLVPTRAAAYHFGSYAMVVEPVAQTQRALIERERGHGVIAWDPNLRLNVEPDLGRWQDLLRWMLPRTHLLKVSDEDLRLLDPALADPAATEAWALACLGQGVALVVVTRGAQGATAWTPQGRAAAQPLPVQVADTVGAGDTFQAALLTALAERGWLSVAGLRSLSLPQMAEVIGFASRAAALTCTRVGADLPRRNELG